MSEIDERSIAFLALQAARRLFREANRAIYVCTICGKVQPPTQDKNIRCNRCSAPIKASLLKIQHLQRQMRGRDRETKMQIAEIIQEVRMLRQELFTLIKVPRVREIPEEEKYKPRPFQAELYAVQFKDGRKMKVRIKSIEERSKMYYRMKEIKATATFISKERVQKAMEDIRQSMMEEEKKKKNG